MQDAALTLRGFFARYFVPRFLADARPRTIEQYEESIRLWSLATDVSRSITLWADAHSSLSLAEITDETMSDFRSWLTVRTSGSRPISPATTNKHLRHVQAVLNKAGPASPGNRDALGIIGRTPWCKSLRESKPRPRAIPDDDLSSIYLSCSVATLPVGLSILPCAWWRLAIVLARTTGFRRGALWSLSWDAVDWRSRTITCDAAADKAGRARVKPLHSVAVEHLLASRQPSGFIIPWAHSCSAFQSNWRRIQRDAGVGPFKWHDIKRACGSSLHSVASPWVVQRMLDHAKLETSLHYIDATPALAAAVDAMAIPAAFKRRSIA